jgi:hypothetical protein
MLHEVGFFCSSVQDEGFEATVMFHLEGLLHPLTYFGRCDARRGVGSAVEALPAGQ